uniref:C-mannosyltransferase DPY19L1 n=1 Tax=Denticeps clupeoides TaxID=299321 RepID=A0AAY4A4L2_9TELE
MAVKSRRQSGKDPAPHGGQAAPPASAKSRRPGRDGKGGGGGHGHGHDGSSQGKNGVFVRNKPGLAPSAVLRTGATLLLAVVAGVFHWYHLTRLFENDRHFSHLSALEKEMAFRTEMGLYYSYFKTIIEAPTFLNGLHHVMNDGLTEYPLVINTLKRFNLYPEVVLASWYRTYSGTMGLLGIPTKMCWSINRGEGLSPVESCEGMGDPAYFYVAFVFLLNGSCRVYGLWLYAVLSTRVMWTPPLRESFSYPFLVLQMLLLTYILRTREPGKKAMVALGLSNVFFMLPWQFAQFVLLTQVASLFACYILGYLNPVKMQSLLVTHMISLGVCFVLMFGNSMLLTSFYASSLVSIWGIIALRHRFAGVFSTGLVLWVMQGLAWVASTVAFKFVASKVFGSSDDAHISSLIKSKFTSYKDFDTMMYTCAAEFDFMEVETPLRYIKTLLLPINLLVVAAVVGRVQWGVEIMVFYCVLCALFLKLVYHSLQLIAFAVLAVLIMRLKLFLTPHMCIMASLVCSRQLFGWIGEKLKLQLVAFAILALMAVQGVSNLQNQWGIIGEFSNLPQEQLLEWIKANTKPSAVFAGAMPTMASVKLSAGRPIVNHPHYEDAGLRERTKMVYAMYSRKPAEVVKRNLQNLQVDFFILEDSWCTRRSRPGCSMPEIWDLGDQENAGKIPLCTILSRDSQPHFKTVFQNTVYKVLKVPKASKVTR